MKAQINGKVLSVTDYLAKNVGTRSNPEVYLESITTEDGKTYKMPNPRVKIVTQ